MKFGTSISRILKVKEKLELQQQVFLIFSMIAIKIKKTYFYSIRIGTKGIKHGFKSKPDVL